MNSTTVSFRRSIHSGFTAFLAAFKSILLFEIVYKAVTTLAIKPLLAHLVQLLMDVWGEDFTFNDGIWQFAITVPGIIAIVLLLFVSILCVYFEFAVVISLARQALEDREKPTDIKAAVVRGLWAFPSLKTPSVLLFAVYALGLLPLVNMGVTSSLLPQLAIPNFITGELTKSPLGKWLFPVLFVFLFILFFCLLFTLPAMVLERRRFCSAVKKSLASLWAYRFKMLGIALIFAAAWAVLFLAPRQIFNFLFGSTSVSFTEALAYYGVSLRTPVMLLIWLTLTLLQIVLMPLLLTLLTACYLPLADVQEPDEAAREKIKARLDKVTSWFQNILHWLLGLLGRVYRWLMARPFIYKHRKGLAVLLCLMVASAFLVAALTNYGVHDPIVIGHRGSAYGVENTLEAIQSAIDAGANYAEVDVLLSADGVPMVIHDTNLQRLSGQNKNVYDLTAAELQKIPLSQNGYTGRISTLEDVVEYCDGKILLAVEYKLHGREEKDLIRETMKVMTQSAYQKHSLYLSMDYGLVSQMKEQYPSYLTGYCVYGNVGQLSTDGLWEMNIDFLLVEEWMATRDFVRACGKAWVPVYVWTVNRPERMDDYLRMGVAGLVTDYPDDAMEIVGSMYDLSDMITPHQARE